MLPTLTNVKAQRFRALALAALFVFVAMQGLEASHSHLEQDSAGHCLLCKNSTDTATAIANPDDALPQAYQAPVTLTPRAAIAPPHKRFSARAPPYHS